MNELKTLQEEKELLQNHGEKRIRDLSDYRFASEEARLGIIHIVRHEIMKAFEKAHTLGIMKGVELVEGVLDKEPAPSLDIYLDKVKNGNKDDMYDYGVKLTRDMYLSNITKLKQELK